MGGIPGFRAKDWSLKNIGGLAKDAATLGAATALGGPLGSGLAAMSMLSPKPNVPQMGALPAVPLPESLAPKRRKTPGDLTALFREFAGIRSMGA